MNVGVCTFVLRPNGFMPILGYMEDVPDKSGSIRARVLIADDHDLIRQALRAVIDDEPDMEVVGEACDGEQAVAMALALKPDAMVMDIQMPKMSGVEATGRIKQLLPEVTILVLTVHDSNEYILRILEAGASGYLTKGIISKDIPAAIRAAINGESILSEEILRKLLTYALRYPTRQQALETQTTLTEREAEILELVAQGASNKIIASQLNLSQNTIKKYMMGIFAKLGATSRTGAVINAQQIGLLSRHD
jgi:DNA-binding NarL/FixJ family response regulator